MFFREPAGARDDVQVSKGARVRHGTGWCVVTPAATHNRLMALSAAM